MGWHMDTRRASLNSGKWKRLREGNKDNCRSSDNLLIVSKVDFLKVVKTSVSVYMTMCEFFTIYNLYLSHIYTFYNVKIEVRLVTTSTTKTRGQKQQKNNTTSGPQTRTHVSDRHSISAGNNDAKKLHWHCLWHILHSMLTYKHRSLQKVWFIDKKNTGMAQAHLSCHIFKNAPLSHGDRFQHQWWWLLPVALSR